MGFVLARAEWQRRRRFSEEAVRVKGVEEMDLGYKRMSKMAILFTIFSGYWLPNSGKFLMFREFWAKVKQFRIPHIAMCDKMRQYLIPCPDFG